MRFFCFYIILINSFKEKLKTVFKHDSNQIFYDSNFFSAVFKISGNFIGISFIFYMMFKYDNKIIH